jgi:hypothetical protein
VTGATELPDVLARDKLQNMGSIEPQEIIESARPQETALALHSRDEPSCIGGMRP